MTIELRLPDFEPGDSLEEIALKLDQMARALEVAFQESTQPAGGAQIGYAVQNMGTPRRTIDFSSATATEVREALSTLIKDLRDVGRLS